MASRKLEGRIALITGASRGIDHGAESHGALPGPVHTEMNDRRGAYDAKRLGVSFSELESRLTPIGQAFNVCGGVAT